MPLERAIERAERRRDRAAGQPSPSGERTSRLPPTVERVWGTTPPDEFTPPSQRPEAPTRVPTEEEAVAERDFFADAALLFPWLPNELLNVFAAAWARTGDIDLAVAEMRRSPAYDRHFAGNRRDDGSFRFGEQEYARQREGFGLVLDRLGVPQPRDFRALFEADIDAQQFGGAVSEVAEMFRDPGGDRPTEFVSMFVDNMLRTGSADLALDAVRESGLYQRTFRGIRRDDGSLRMTEREYFADMHAYRVAVGQFGINPDIFDRRGRFHDLIGGDVSPDEFRDRLDAVDKGLRNFGPRNEDGYSYAKQFYSQNYGVQLSNEAILLSATDPAIGREVLDRRIDLSQIGGAAASFGFSRSLRAVERLAGFGLSGQAAMDFYGQAGERLPTLDALTRRHGRGVTGIGEFEEASLVRDVGAQQRLERALGAEQSAFSRRDLVERDRETGGLSGLRQR